jgi:hypothetical protein
VFAGLELGHGSFSAKCKGVQPVGVEHGGARATGEQRDHGGTGLGFGAQARSEGQNIPRFEQGQCSGRRAPAEAAGRSFGQRLAHHFRLLDRDTLLVGRLGRDGDQTDSGAQGTTGE